MAFDGYIRVSSTRGRGGDSFISPDQQRKAIQAYATLAGITITVWHTDLDMSGGKTTRPGLDLAMSRCETGLSEGIIVAKMDRFARSLLGALELFKRLDAAGAEFISVSEQLDSRGPAGKMMQRMMLVFAEFELDRIKDTWRNSQQAAVERGMEIAKAKGAKRALALPVSIPSHCALMKPAAESLAVYLQNVPMTASNVPVIHNADVLAYSDVNQMKDALVRQLYSPVRWVETVQSAYNQGITNSAECGPGKVLAALTKRIVAELPCVALTNVESLAEAQAQFSA
jgi:DNA invertase Pin-like site-specific DNA recombinase